MSNPTLPGFPKKSADAIERRARIGAAVVNLHREIAPLLEVLDSKASIAMTFKVGGDTMKVSVVPGKPNDDENL
jgi:hypothetical protein